ncbi:hypothetical protein F5X98DRAFT_343444 [Xylaria grammica]|nr:hypothetical protein F5X98DRAFT_343444 [Xylaria grammica]
MSWRLSSHVTLGAASTITGLVAVRYLETWKCSSRREDNIYGYAMFTQWGYYSTSSIFFL